MLSQELEKARRDSDPRSYRALAARLGLSSACPLFDWANLAGQVQDCHWKDGRVSGSFSMPCHAKLGKNLLQAKADAWAWLQGLYEYDKDLTYGLVLYQGRGKHSNLTCWDKDGFSANQVSRFRMDSNVVEGGEVFLQETKKEYKGVMFPSKRSIIAVDSGSIVRQVWAQSVKHLTIALWTPEQGWHTDAYPIEET